MLLKINTINSENNAKNFHNGISVLSHGRCRAQNKWDMKGQAINVHDKASYIKYDDPYDM